MRLAIYVASALGLALAFAPLAEARADEAPAPIKWVEGWEKGKAAAKEKGKLMLVYVHRVSPP